MAAAQRLRTARAFWLDEEAANEQVQAVLLIAQHKKFRPKTVIGLDVDRKARHLASLVSLPDAMAARVLIVYHLAEERPMMGAFLDALDIKHDNGVIEGEAVKPDAQKLGSAVAALTEQFPRDHVSLYLSTLLCQDPDTWGGLAAIENAPLELGIGN
jgi:hypothetical protein